MKLAKRMIIFDEVSHGNVEIIANLYNKTARFNESIYDPGDDIAIVASPDDGYYTGLISVIKVHDSGEVPIQCCNTEFDDRNNKLAITFHMPNDDICIHVKFSKLMIGDESFNRNEDYNSYYNQHTTERIIKAIDSLIKNCNIV